MAKPRKLLVCTKGKKCPDRGSKDVLRELRKQAEELGIDIEVEKSGCLKLCKFGPAVCGLPEDTEYVGVTKSDCRELVQAHASGDRVERLVRKRKDKKK